MAERRALAAFMLTAVVFVVRSEVRIPGLRHFRYHQPGNVTIAVFLDIHEFSREEFCSDTVAVMNIARVESVLYSIDLINKRDDLLPNITLGVAIFDSCKKDTTALASAVQLIPASDGSAAAVALGNSSGSVATETPVGWHVGPQDFDVVGLLGVGFSRQAVMVAGFLSLFQLPVLSQWATSDELSDEARYPYFMRLVSPDMFVTRVMVETAVYFNWTYVSLIYGEGSYGENAGRRLEKLTKEQGICLAVNRRMSSNADREEYEEIGRMLWANKKARAVLIILEHFHLKMFLKTMDDMGLRDHFVWIGSEAFNHIYDRDVEPQIKRFVTGSFFMNPPSGEIPGYVDYFGQITPENRPDHPWLEPYWKLLFNCDWATNVTCRQASLTSVTDSLSVATRGARDVDGTMVYANSIHQLISEKCPEAFLSGSVPEGCIHGDELLKVMKSVRMPGVSEEVIAFDETGDVLGSYNIYQMQSDGDRYWQQKLGRWSRLDGKMSMDTSALMWPGETNSERQRDVVKSICSEPCGPRESTIPSDLPCCWECRPCKKNEILPPNATMCEECPLKYWPDPEIDSLCARIAPTFLCVCRGDWIGIGLAGLAGIGVLIGLLVTGAFVRYKRHKLIKATGRELSLVILIGVLLANVDVFLLITKPSRFLCTARDAMFQLAITFLYAPLFLKTVRIYRIFVGGGKGKSRVRFISSGAQMVFLALLILTEILLIVISQGVWSDYPEEVMPQPGQAYVELYCHQNMAGFLLPLSLNLVVVIACAVLGFLSRKLPENFNESWFIFVSVSTTLFMWCVFLPTYFSAFYASHKVALIALCLILNSAITICCQFVPKVYAVKFVGVDMMDVASNLTGVTTIHVAPVSTISRSRHSNT